MPTQTFDDIAITNSLSLGGDVGLSAVNVPYIATSVDNSVFIARRRVTVTAISCTPRVVGSDGGAVTAMVNKCTGTQAPASGTNLQTATFDLKTGADTVQNATLTATASALTLEAGDRLAVDFTGTMTAAVGVITIWLQPVKGAA